QRSQLRIWRLFGARDRDMAETSATKSDSIQKSSSSSAATPATVQDPGSSSTPGAKTAQAASTETVQATTGSARTAPAAADAASGHHDAECSQEGRRSSTSQRRGSDRDAFPITLAGLAASPVRRIIFLRIRSAGARQ